MMSVTSNIGFYGCHLSKVKYIPDYRKYHFNEVIMIFLKMSILLSIEHAFYGKTPLCITLTSVFLMEITEWRKPLHNDLKYFKVLVSVA